MIKVWTNGCFDILHRGHIELFRYAKSLGDELVVGIDTDEKVKLDKGSDRPINNVQDRIFMLQSIKYIDCVVTFDSTDDLNDTIKWYKPDIMVIGSDWRGKDVIGQEFAGKLVFFDRVEGYSTTKILGKND
jgi:rfaE bifunctional protein nucleotidyltransferase chain/domain